MQYRHVLLCLTLLLSIGCAEQQQNILVASKPAPTTVKAVGINGLDGNEEQAVLSYHNQVRASVNIPPLTWSAKLAQHAANKGAKLAAQGCTLQHSKKSNYGENLFIGAVSLNHEAVIEAAKAWESEKINYSGDKLNKANRSQVGHYTQMVWRDTKQLGCAKIACGNQLIVVCHYAPAGNHLGKKPY
jgi:pathogenesis-related protein 1